MLRQRADGEVVDDPARALADHVDGVRLRVGDVDARRVVARPRRASVAGPVGGVDVVRVEQRRDPGRGARRRRGRVGRAWRRRRGRGGRASAWAAGAPPPQPATSAAREHDAGPRRSRASSRRAAPGPRRARARPRRVRRPRARGRRRRPRTGPRARRAAARRVRSRPVRVDRPDRAPLAVEGVAAAAEDVEASRRARPRRRGRAARGDARSTRTRPVAGSMLRTSRRAVVPVGAAGDEDATADRGHRRVAQRMRERRDVADGVVPGRKASTDRSGVPSSCSRRSRRSRRPSVAAVVSDIATGRRPTDARRTRARRRGRSCRSGRRRSRRRTYRRPAEGRGAGVVGGLGKRADPRRGAGRDADDRRPPTRRRRRGRRRRSPVGPSPRARAAGREREGGS